MAFLDESGVTRLTTDYLDIFSRKSHTHYASDITNGTLSVARGGTGSTTAADARRSLGIDSGCIAPYWVNMMTIYDRYDSYDDDTGLPMVTLVLGPAATGTPYPEYFTDGTRISIYLQGMLTSATDELFFLQINSNGTPYPVFVNDAATGPTNPLGTINGIADFVFDRWRWYYVGCTEYGAAGLAKAKQDISSNATNISTNTTNISTNTTNISTNTTGISKLSSSIATVDQSTATTNHAKGSHFMLGNQLRKATSAIATGNSITNSNSTTDTLQGQIDTINSSLVIQNGGTSDEKVLYVVYGKVVQIFVRGVANATSSAYTMPSGLRPRAGMDFIGGKAAITYDGVVSTNTTNAWDNVIYVATH